MLISQPFKGLLTSLLRQCFAWCFAGSFTENSCSQFTENTKVKLQIGSKQNTHHIISNNVLVRKKNRDKAADVDYGMPTALKEKKRRDADI